MVEKTTQGIWPFSDPRVAGIREHLSRIDMFAELGRSASSQDVRFRFLITRIYSARAITEIMLEAAKNGLTDCSRDELERELQLKLPWYALIEKIRIHDFHRFGLTPPRVDVREIHMNGPVKLRAQKGMAISALGAAGPEEHVTGNSKIENQRPLAYCDGRFLDEATGQWVSLDLVLADYVKAVPFIVDDFEKRLQR